MSEMEIVHRNSGTGEEDSIDKPGDPCGEEPQAPNPDNPVPSTVYLVGVVCGLAGLVFGYDIGGSGGTFVMSGFQQEMGWERSIPGDDTSEWASWVSAQQGWIGSLFPLGAFIGAVPAGWGSDLVGRRMMMMVANVIFTVGAILQMAAVHIGMLYAGRMISGMGIGTLSCLAGIYSCELAPAKLRGLVVACFQLCITIGIFMAGLLNIGLATWSDGWRISYGGNALFSILMLVGMIFMSESPRWLMMKGRDDDASVALRKFRHDDIEVEYEMYLIRKDLEGTEGVAGWGEVFCGPYKQTWRTSLGCFIQFFQQWTGINAVMFFAPSIIESFLGSTAGLWGNLAIQFANFLATFIAIYFVDRAGRIRLLWTGGVGMGTALFTVVFLAGLADYKNDTGAGWAIVAFCCIYVMFFAYSWGPLGWVVCSEIHSNRVRGKGVALSTATNWINAFVVGRVTPEFLKSNVLDLWGTFLVFGCMVVGMTLFIWFLLPETAGVLPEHLDLLFVEWKGGKFVRDKWTPPLTNVGSLEKERV